VSQNEKRIRGRACLAAARGYGTARLIALHVNGHACPCEAGAWFDYGSTVNGPALRSVPVGVVTWSAPVVAPIGTVAVISVAASMVKADGVPLKVMLVAPVRSVPSI
jgi:hypothetical protein